jgi:hypothetical protein
MNLRDSLFGRHSFPSSLGLTFGAMQVDPVKNLRIHTELVHIYVRRHRVDGPGAMQDI